MIEFHKVWIEQCEAARDIREAFGLEKAIRYLVGEKLPELPRGLPIGTPPSPPSCTVRRGGQRDLRALGDPSLPRIAGRTSGLTQTVESLEVEHHAVERALRGSEVALKVRERVRRHDEVLLVREP